MVIDICAKGVRAPAQEYQNGTNARPQREITTYAFYHIRTTRAFPKQGATGSRVYESFARKFTLELNFDATRRLLSVLLYEKRN